MAPPADFTNDERFDGLYATIASQTRGIEPLLDSMFSFLRRKTDFFDGPADGTGGTASERQEKAVSVVERTVRKHVELHIEDKAKKGEAKRASMRMKEEAEEKRKEKIMRQREQTTTRRERAKRGGGGEDDDVMEIEADGSGFDISKQSGMGMTTTTAAAAASIKGDIAIKIGDDVPATTTASARTMTKDEDATAADVGEVEDDKEEPPPVGNGGTVDGKYVWTQTLSELSVIVPLPNNTRGKDLIVVIGKNTLKVELLPC